MSTVITERAVLLLNPSADVEDPSSEAGKIFTNLLATIAAQPGFVSGHWGRRVGIDKNDVEHIVGKSIRTVQNRQVFSNKQKLRRIM